MNENMEALIWWRDRLPLLDLTDKERQIVGSMTGSIANFGYEQGDIRPGELGQWDVFFSLEQDWGIPQERAAMIAGLEMAVVKGELNKEVMRDCGVDPNNPEEVAAFQAMQAMTAEERDSEIKRLEAILKQ